MAKRTQSTPVTEADAITAMEITTAYLKGTAGITHADAVAAQMTTSDFLRHRERGIKEMKKAAKKQ